MLKIPRRHEPIKTIKRVICCFLVENEWFVDIFGATIITPCLWLPTHTFPFLSPNSEHRPISGFVNPVKYLTVLIACIFAETIFYESNLTSLDWRGRTEIMQRPKSIIQRAKQKNDRGPEFRTILEALSHRFSMASEEFLCVDASLGPRIATRG